MSVTVTQKLISIKFNSDDPTDEQFNDILKKIGDFLPARYNVRNPRVKGKYIYFDMDMPDYIFQPDEIVIYIQGIISGILMEKGVEII